MLGAASVEELMQVACVWILQRTRRRRQCTAPPYPTVQSTNHNTRRAGLTRTGVTRQESPLDLNTLRLQINKKEKVLPWLGLGIVFMTSSVDILGS